MVEVVALKTSWKVVLLCSVERCSAFLYRNSICPRPLLLIVEECWRHVAACIDQFAEPSRSTRKWDASKFSWPRGIWPSCAKKNKIGCDCLPGISWNFWIPPGSTLFWGRPQVLQYPCVCKTVKLDGPRMGCSEIAVNGQTNCWLHHLDISQGVPPKYKRHCSSHRNSLTIHSIVCRLNLINKPLRAEEQLITANHRGAYHSPDQKVHKLYIYIYIYI